MSGRGLGALGDDGGDWEGTGGIERGAGRELGVTGEPLESREGYWELLEGILELLGGEWRLR